jgi:hypothetical protein
MHSKFKAVADLVGGEVHHSGGNILNVRVVDSNFGRQTFDFGMEPGDVVGYDRCIDGEYMDSGELRVLADETSERIAEEIRALLSQGRKYHER